MNIIQTNLKFGAMSYGNNPNALVYHHAEASNCTVQDIHQWHLNNGWAGIGYHFFAKKDGSIYKGRPDNAIGSHCLHHNTNTLGICAEGNYMTETMPQVQKNALIALGQYLKNLYGISAVYGHNELYNTSCPGTNYPMSEIKAAVMGGAVAPKPTQSNNTIQQLQSNLNLLHIASLVTDGISGSNTENAVKKFQLIMGLVADGVAGSNTQGAISQILSRPLDGASQPHYEYATRYIQWRIGASIDGAFGNGTAYAVKAWQKNNGLGADGVVGNQSWSKLI